MPKEDKKNGGTAAQAAPVKKTMLGEFVGEYGKSEKDIVHTGILLPQYLGRVLVERVAIELKKPFKEITDEEVAAANITPCVGLYDRTEILPVQKKNDPNQRDFAPYSLVIRQLRFAVPGFRGKEDEREEELVEKGKDILFAVTGELTVDKQIHDMIEDLENIYLFAARPSGVQKLKDRPTPMTNFDIEIVKTDLKRADMGATWMLPPWYVVCAATGALRSSIRNKEHVGLLHVHTTDGLETTAVGNVINRKTGEVVARIGDGGRVLPPERRLAETSTSAS